MPSIQDTAQRLPEWEISTWLNSSKPITIAALRGRVVVVHSFQMLCPGCVTNGLPQAERVRQQFSASEVAVIGLHTVFEHHGAMTVEALQAFVFEYRWSFPIGVDMPGTSGSVPRTMERYGLQGTPSLIVLDRQGFIRFHQFGHVDDLKLGALIGNLLGEEHDGEVFSVERLAAMRGTAAGDCTADGCSIEPRRASPTKPASR